eukprot:1133428-Pleurochrysis_carterae.AAC.1
MLRVERRFRLRVCSRLDVGQRQPLFAHVLVVHGHAVRGKADEWRQRCDERARGRAQRRPHQGHDTRVGTARGHPRIRTSNHFLKPRAEQRLKLRLELHLLRRAGDADQHRGRGQPPAVAKQRHNLTHIVKVSSPNPPGRTPSDGVGCIRSSRCATRERSLLLGRERTSSMITSTRAANCEPNQRSRKMPAVASESRGSAATLCAVWPKTAEENRTRRSTEEAAKRNL